MEITDLKNKIELSEDFIISYVNNKFVIEILKKYSIDIESLIKDFIPNFFSSYLEEVNINSLIKFIKLNKIEIDDFCLLCDSFKNKYLETIKNNKKYKEELALLYEQNFSKILLCFIKDQNKTIQEQNHFLINQSKYTSMGEMMPMIVHQWRQPLQTVSILVQKISFTKMIEKELKDEFIDKVTTDVTNQLNYMSRTMDDFRDFFKPSKSISSIMCSKLIQKAVDFFHHTFEIDDIHFEIKTIADIQLNLCINDIVQVLINIIKNARDALVDNCIDKKIITITHYCNEKFAIIEIEDNAGGISNNIIHKVFDQYFSTKKEKGTGLGLYMSKKIIEEYYFGRLNAKNINNGVLFKIELPLN